MPRKPYRIIGTTKLYQCIKCKGWKAETKFPKYKHKENEKYYLFSRCHQCGREDKFRWAASKVIVVAELETEELFESMLWGSEGE
jgi:RNase P subunit RPR2